VSTRFFWAANYGQIYPELRRLEFGLGLHSWGVDWCRRQEEELE
jgi:hypothetical protein